MSDASTRWADRAVPLLAGATVVAFAAGSSSVRAVKEASLDLRWVVLLALTAAASWWARGKRPSREVSLAALGAAGLVTLAIVSAVWSVAPESSVGRGVSVGILLATAALLAIATAGRSTAADALLNGLLGGGVAVALAGLVLVAVDRGTAVEDATYEAPARFRGFGEDPNTVSLLLAIVLPVALTRLLASRRVGERVAAGSVTLLFAASIAASGSRGALLAAAVGSAGTLVLATSSLRGRATALAALAAVVTSCAAAQALPDAARTRAVGGTPQSSGPAASTAPKPPFVDVESVYPLNADVGRPLPLGGEPAVTRSYLGASGRTAAWKGALEAIANRPLLGYGFGTEARVFVDRYYSFVGSRPENSYLGMLLQLGVVGLSLLLGLVLLLLWSARRVVCVDPLAAACVGVVLAGLAVGVVQSFLYAAGNVAAATFWIAAFLLPATAGAAGSR